MVFVCDPATEGCGLYHQVHHVAVRDDFRPDEGDHYVLNGSKIWTSYGDKGDWMFCLVRTDVDARKHEGISFVLLDMTTPGVTTKPIRLISGSSPFTETFFENARVEKNQAVGEVNKGWTVAKYLLEVCMLEHTFMVYPPSLQSAAAMYLSRAMLGRGAWDHNLHHYSGYSEVEVMDCVARLIDALRKPVKFEALFKKYASKKFIKASLYVRDWCKKDQNVDPILDKPGDGQYLVENDWE